MLNSWIKMRTSLGLIRTVRGNRLTEAYVRRLLPKLGRKAGIAISGGACMVMDYVTPMQRNSVPEGVDIGIISKQLDHRPIATTARYLDHIAPFAVVDAMRERAW